LQGNSYPGAGLSFDDALGYDASIDFTGPIDSGETVLYRFVSEYNDNDSYRNDSWEKAFYASPSITWKISDRSKLNFGLEYHEEQFASDDFLVAPNLDVSQVADVKTRYQDPDDASDESTKIVNLGFEHAFSDNITFNIRMRSTIFESAELAHSNIAIRPNNQFLSRRENYIVNEREFHFLDANTRFKFNTGPFEHSLLVGVAAGREVADFDRRQFFTGPARPNPLSLDVAIHDPVFPTVDTPTTPDTHRRSEVDVRAIYMSNLMTLSEKWKLMLGARYDREEDQSQELRLVAPTLTKEADAVTPMLGLIFQPDETWSFYGSYSESFRPPSTNSRDVNGVNSFDPETGNQIEVGAKAEFANGRVATTLALFRIDRENGLVTGGPGFQVQTGAERSEGGELEVSAEPIDNWRMIAGYAYADARIISDSVANRVGAQSTNSPKHSAHLWTRYDFPDGSSLRGFGAGLGVVYVGERVGTTPSATVTDVLELPSYESIDLGLFYTIDTWDFTLKVNNVLDDVFFSSAANQFNVNPGNPRSLSLRVIKTF
jgi:iron complex outermembrane receptor protein